MRLNASVVLSEAGVRFANASGEKDPARAWGSTDDKRHSRELRRNTPHGLFPLHAGTGSAPLRHDKF